MRCLSFSDNVDCGVGLSENCKRWFVEESLSKIAKVLLCVTWYGLVCVTWYVWRGKKVWYAVWLVLVTVVEAWRQTASRRSPLLPLFCHTQYYTPHCHTEDQLYHSILPVSLQCSLLNLIEDTVPLQYPLLDTVSWQQYHHTFSTHSITESLNHRSAALKYLCIRVSHPPVNWRRLPNVVPCVVSNELHDPWYKFDMMKRMRRSDNY